MRTSLAGFLGLVNVLASAGSPVEPDPSRSTDTRTHQPRVLRDGPALSISPLEPVSLAKSAGGATVVNTSPPDADSQRLLRTVSPDAVTTLQSRTALSTTNTVVATSPSITSILLRSTTTSSPTTSPSPSSVSCWMSRGCAPFVDDLTAAYNVSGNMTDPNQRGQDGSKDQSRVFQIYFCQDTDYKDVVFNGISGPGTHLYQCVQCFRQSGIDTDTPNTPTMKFLWKVYDFCHTDQPSLYDLLEHLLSFMQDLHAPTSLGNMPAQITAVVDSLRDQFTWTSGMNQPTTVPTSSWWQTSLGPDSPIPTEYLAQVPSDWPYTDYGITRKVGKTTSWPFVNPNATTQTVAWLYHSILWNPRPVFTPKSVREKLNGTLYNPLLDGWKREFIYDTVVVTPTPSPTESGALSKSKTLVPPRFTLDLSMVQVSTTWVGSDGDAVVRGTMRSKVQSPMVITEVAKPTVNAQGMMEKVSKWMQVFESVVDDDVGSDKVRSRSKE